MGFAQASRKVFPMKFTYGRSFNKFSFFPVFSFKPSIWVSYRLGSGFPFRMDDNLITLDMNVNVNANMRRCLSFRIVIIY